MQGSRQLKKKKKKKAVVYHNFTSVRPESLPSRGSASQEAVSTGIFLVNLNTKQGARPWGTVGGTRGVWVPFPSDGWMDGSCERKEETRGQIGLERKSACKAINRQRRQRNRREDHQSKKGTACDTLATGPATHSNRKQNVPEVAKKLGFQFESRGFENR